MMHHYNEYFKICNAVFENVQKIVNSLQILYYFYYIFSVSPTLELPCINKLTTNINFSLMTVYVSIYSSKCKKAFVPFSQYTRYSKIMRTVRNSTLAIKVE
jgi:hypothetical protein